MINIILILLLVFILCLLLKNKETFQPNATNYEIDYDKEKKEIELFNISSKIMGDSVSGFKFNGNGSYIQIPNMELEYYTLSFIVYLDKVKERQYLLANDWELYVENSNLTLKHLNQKFVFEKEIEAKTYTHISVKVNKKQIIIFFEGTEIEYTFNNNFDIKPFLLGTNNNKNNFMLGLLGEIKLFSDILTNKQLCDLHDSCKLKACAYVTDGKTRDECYQNCMDSPYKDCKEEACTNKCYNKSTSGWKPPCEFKPYGSDIFSCMNFCTSKNNCNYSNCQEICEKCEDPEVCPWILSDEQIVNPNPYEPVEITKLEGEPIAPKIFLVPYNGKFLVKWNKPKTYETQEGNIDKYVCFLYKTLNKGEGIQMSKVPHPNCTDCKYVIDNLDKDVYYSVGIRAFNKKGLSKMSNIVSMKPIYKGNKAPVQVPTRAPDKKETYEYCNPTN